MGLKIIQTLLVALFFLFMGGFFHADRKPPEWICKAVLLIGCLVISSATVVTIILIWM